MSQPSPPNTPPFLFPPTESTAVPDPSEFFAPHLLSSPLPTNSFFQNLVINCGDEPAYIHPYLIKSWMSSLSLCYPRRVRESAVINSRFCHDLTISALNKSNENSKHIISSFDDLSVTLDLPSCNLRFFLVRGSPFLTCVVTKSVLSISTDHVIREVSSNSGRTKYTIKFDNNQTWLVYSSSPINLHHGLCITSGQFSGTIRIALLAESNPFCEGILDHFNSSCYPISGHADITKPFCVEYKYEKKGEGDLLMLAHPLHVRLLPRHDRSITLLEDFKYESIDGELVGVVGDSWVLKSNTLQVNWSSVKGIEKESYSEICDALCEDVKAMCGQDISIELPHLYGKMIAGVARLALIAEEVLYSSVISEIVRFLKDKIEPWLDEADKEETWDWGRILKFGLCHDHHFQIGYFIYVIAVLAKIDTRWGTKYKQQAYSLVSKFMNLNEISSCPRLRYFDLWQLHSWAGRLRKFGLDRYQDSPSEALNAYYSAALIGVAYDDPKFIDIGSTLSAMEILAANTWWHVRERDNVYPEEFTMVNRMVRFLTPTLRIGKAEGGLDLQILPLLPVTEFLFSDIEYVKELVKWSMTDLAEKEFVCALEAIYDKEVALDKIRNLKWFAYGSSRTNLLWWIHSRGDIPSPFGSCPTLGSATEKLSAVTSEGKVSSGDDGSGDITDRPQKSTSLATEKLSTVSRKGKVSSGDYGSGDITGRPQKSTSLGTRKFTYKELQDATENFSDCLGRGSFGIVYKGILEDGKEVAIKVLNKIGEGGDRDFWTEVEIISQIKHPCLVKLLGYCNYELDRFLVYDYVPNKTLHYHLHCEGRPVMAWKYRVKVAFDAAQGIAYLHEDCGVRIIHRDIKSDNILLDDDFNAKVADFGFAKLEPGERTIVTTRVAGTFGYFAPEYAMNGILSEKSDVYSFGVVLLELITGRESLVEPLGRKMSLVDWANPFLKKPFSDENLQTLIDGKLQNSFEKSEMIRMIETAADCVRINPFERPKISEVVNALKQKEQTTE